MLFSRPIILGMGIPDEVHKTFSNTEDLLNFLGGNVGNLAFHEAIINYIGPNLKKLWWGSSSQKINSNGDVAIIPCANHLRQNFSCRNVNQSFKDVTIPLVAVGLGSDGPIDSEKETDISDDIKELVSIIAEHAPSESPNITLRSPDALKIMSRLGLQDACTVLGCPSLFISPEKKLGEKIINNLKEIKNIVILAGNSSWSYLSPLENKLTKLISDNGAYLIQHPLNMIKLARTKFSELTDEEISKIKKFSCHYMNNEEFFGFVNKKCITFFSLNPWLEYYRNFDFVVGARIHGTILALQMGIPALCIAHDKRTLEMCKFMNIPFVKYSDIIDMNITNEFLLDTFRAIFNENEFDEKRMDLARGHQKFFTDNKIRSNFSLLKN